MPIALSPLRIGSGVCLGGTLDRAHPLNVGKVAHWRALPGRMAGPTWYDLAGTRHGTLAGGATWGPTTRPGGDGELRLDGSTGHVNCGRPAGIGGTSGLTVAAWCLTTTVAGSAGAAGLRYVVGDEDTLAPAASAFMLRLNPGNATFEFYVMSAGAYYGPAAYGPVATGTWYRLVATCAPGGLTLFVGGVAAGTAAAPSSVNIPTTDVTIGAATTETARIWQGSIDDVVIASRAWSAAEVALDYGLSRRGSPGVLNRSGLGASSLSPAAPAFRRPLGQRPGSRGVLA